MTFRLGEAALVSHTSGKKHKEIVSRSQHSLSIASFIPPATVGSPESRSSGFQSGASVKDVLVAELYWALNVVTSVRYVTEYAK